jgi:hypothetical protein
MSALAARLAARLTAEPTPEAAEAFIAAAQRRK